MDQTSFLTGVEILDTSVATSTSGSLYTYGGISIFNTNTANSTSASFLTLGGATISKNTLIGGDVNITSTTLSTNTSTGALTISGGLSVQNNLYGNFANFSNIQASIGATLPNLVTTNASIGTLSLSTFNPTNITTNNLVVLTASSIANAVFTNITTTNLALANNFSVQTINVTGTTASLSTSTGAIIISGGIGVSQFIFANRGFFGDTINLTNNSRPMNLVDTRAAISCWRWAPPTGSNSNNPAVEFIAGTAATATATGNNYSDIYMDDSASIVFRNRTTGGSLVTFWAGQTGNIGIGTTTPGFKLDTIGDARVSGNFTVGTRLFTPNAIINTFTSGNALFNSTLVSTSTSTGAVIVNGGVGIGGALNVAGNIVIGGNLTVSGTLVTVNSTTVNINDNILVLNAGPSGTSDSGVLINRYQISNNTGTGDIVSDTTTFNGTLQTGTSTSVIVLPSGASSLDSFYNGYWVKITSGTANNNVRQIVSYVGSSRTATLSLVLTSTPTANTDTFNLYGNAYATNYFKESTKEYVLGYTNDALSSLITDVTYANLRLSNLTGSLISASNLITTNISSIYQTIANILATNINSTNVTTTNISGIYQTIGNILATNINSTNVTISNLSLTTSLNVPTLSVVTTASIGTSFLVGTSAVIGTTLQVMGATQLDGAASITGALNVIGGVTLGALTAGATTVTSLTTNQLTITNLICTNETITNTLVTNLRATTSTITNLNLTGLTSSNILSTNFTSGSINSININTTNLTSNNALFTNVVTINSTVDSSSTSGSLLTNGGISVRKSVNIGSTVNSINTSTGALIVSGGAGFNGDIYAKNLYSNGVLVSSGGGNIFGTEYNYEEILPTSGTTSINFQQRVSMTTSSLLGGTYKINMGYVFDRPSVNNQDGIFQVLLDPTGLGIGELIHEYVDRNNRNTFVLPQYSSVTKNLTPGIHFVSLIWRTASNGSIIYISNARLELFRVQ
jgi:hypothetical protein